MELVKIEGHNEYLLKQLWSEFFKHTEAFEFYNNHLGIVTLECFRENDNCGVFIWMHNSVEELLKEGLCVKTSLDFSSRERALDYLKDYPAERLLSAIG